MNTESEDKPNDQTFGYADLEQRLESLWNVSRPPTQQHTDFSIGNYRVINLLGRGAFGIVYLAEDLKTGDRVALKLPRPEVLIEPERRKRFAAEATLAAKLSHPGIVEVFEAETFGPTPFIAAAYCNGPNLAEWMQGRGDPPPWRESVSMMAKIADAVDYAHSQGISHRDLKPANIMLVSSDPDDLEAEQLQDYDPKVTDFGLAKLSDPTLTDTKSSLLIGTPSYMAPEQIERSERSNHAFATDIYSLGVILFEMLTKQMPISGDTYFEVLDNIRTASPIGLRTIRSDLPRCLAKICATCLQKNPQARYQTAAALAEDLRNCATDRPIVGKRTSLIAKSIYWCTHPNRIKTAGAFTLYWQSTLLAWFYVSIASLCMFKIVTMEQYFKIMSQDAMIIVLSTIPMCWAGWIALKGDRKGVWIALAFTALILPLASIPLFSEPILFKSVYAGQEPYFSFIVHMVPASGFIVQAFLLGCAIVAMRRQAD